MTRREGGTNTEIVIGVCTQTYSIDSSFYGSREVFGALDYYHDALARAGADGVLILSAAPGASNMDAAAAALVRRVDGLLLAGGGDIAPEHYGLTVADVEGLPVYGIDRHRDAFEIAAIHAARQLGTPTLGICRGIQIGAVAAGARLRPHLANHPTNRARYAGESVHNVEISTGTRLYDVFGEQSIRVNSLHHQGVHDGDEEMLTRTFEIAAYSDDGVIEGLTSAKGDRWPFIGVQWHPEASDEAYAGRLFEWLVTEAGRFRS